MIQIPAVERIDCQNKSNNHKLLIFFGKYLFIWRGWGQEQEHQGTSTELVKMWMYCSQMK